MPNYIFFKEDKVQFTFTDNTEKKVLQHIENNLYDYYDDKYNSPEDKLRILKRQTREKGLAQAIADDTFINASVVEVEPITKI